MPNEISMLNRQIEDLKAEVSRLQQSENEAVYRGLFENNHAVMLLIDPETAAIKDANPAACAYYGWSREEMKALRIDEINTVSKEEVFAQMQLARAEKRRNFFFKHRRADGSVRDVEVYSGPLTLRGQTLLYSIVHDITDRVQAQKLLAESERRLSTLMANLPGMAYRCLNDEFWTMKFVSEGCFELTGYAPDHLLENRRTSFAEMIHPDERQMVWEQVERSLERRSQFNLTYRIHTASGEEKWVEEKGQGVFSRSGNLLAIEGFVTDITDRKRAEKALLQSEALYRGIFENASIGMTRVSLDGIYREVNPAMTRILGYSSAEMIGSPVAAFTYPEDLGRRSQFLLDLIDGKIAFGEQERRFAHKNGSSVWTLISASVQRDQHRKPLYFISLVQDINERKLTEQALRESEDRFRMLVESAPIGIFTTTSNGKPLAINLAMARILGCASKEEALERYADLTNDLYAQAERRNEFVRLLRESGLLENFEYQARAADSRTIWLSMNARIADRCVDGSFTIEGFATDITERKRAEIELRESEERHRQIVESSTDAILVRSGEAVIYANPAALRLFRANRAEELVGKPYLDLIHPDDRPVSIERIRKGFNEKWIAPPREHRILTIDGQTVPVESTGVPVQYKGETQLFGVFRDITERKRAENAMRESEARYRTLIENIPQAVLLKDLESKYVSINTAYARTFALHQEEVIGKSDYDFHPKHLADKFQIEDRLVMETGESREFEEESVVKGQKRFYHKIKVPVRDNGGKIHRCSVGAI